MVNRGLITNKARWLLLVAITLVTLLVAPVSPALAGTSDSVTVTASGFIVDAPGNLVVTYISDFELQLSWISPPAANQTMVRGAFGRPVENRSDGFEVYVGTANATTHWTDIASTGVIHYAAFSQSDEGIWEEIGTRAEANFMSLSWVFMVLIFVSAALLAIGFSLRKAAIAFAAAGFWIVAAVFSYTQSSTPDSGTWDIYYGIFWLGIGLTLLCTLEPAIMRPKKEDAKDDIFLDAVSRQEKENDDLWRQTRVPRIGRAAAERRR